MVPEDEMRNKLTTKQISANKLHYFTFSGVQNIKCSPKGKNIVSVIAQSQCEALRERFAGASGGIYQRCTVPGLFPLHAHTT